LYAACLFKEGRLYLERYSRDETRSADNTTTYERVFWAKKFRPTFLLVKV
jgi:hypothetical protein